jgi:hypothetical protein
MGGREWAVRTSGVTLSAPPSPSALRVAKVTRGSRNMARAPANVLLLRLTAARLASLRQRLACGGHRRAPQRDRVNPPQQLCAARASGTADTLAAILRMPNYLRNIWREEISPIARMICRPTIAMGNFVSTESLNGRASIVR